MNSEILGIQFGGKIAWITTNLKLRHNSVNQEFNQCAFIFSFLTGATWYYHAINIVFG